MKETKRKFYKKICKWKKQILCVGAGIFLGIAAWLAQGMDPVIEAGNVIQRPDIDDGQVDQELYVKGLVDQEKEVVLKLPVSARQYTKEEAYQAYEEILKQLPEWIKGDNLSLEEVRQDLELPAYWQGAGVHLSWQSLDPELVESDGTVHTWEFETGDEAIDQWPVILKVRMTDGNWPEEYEIPIKVRPPLYTEEERTIQEFTSLLTSESGYTALCIQRQGDFLQHSQGTCISSNVLSGGSCSGIYKPEGKKRQKESRRGTERPAAYGLFRGAVTADHFPRGGHEYTHCLGPDRRGL